MSADLLMFLAILTLCLGIFFTVRPYLPGSLFVYGAMWIFHSGNILCFSNNELMSWGIMTVIIIALDFMQPQKRWQPVTGSLYLVIGALVGVSLGYCIGSHWLIPGCVLCTLLGAFAYSRTPGGKFLLFSRSTFIHYFCAYGFRVIVSVAMAGIMIGALISKHQAETFLNIN